MDTEMQKTLTKAFIDFDPVTIVLMPKAEVPDGQGGKRRVKQAPRAAQVFTLIEPRNSGFQEPVVTESGEQYTIQFMLLGEHDSVMEVDDVFVTNGKNYKIVAMMPDNGYEKRAVVIQHGSGT